MDNKVSIVPLKGDNYATWALKVKMVLLRDNLLGVVDGSVRGEQFSGDAKKLAEYQERKNRALATIVLAVDPALLYLIPNPESPRIVWKQLSDQFQKKTWSNRLMLKRKLNRLALPEGEPVAAHVGKMTEIFNQLAVIGEPMEDEDKVIAVLASLPESYAVLVTALEARVEELTMGTLAERLIHDEAKQRQDPYS